MLKTLGAQVKEFKKASIATPIFMILEVIMEMIIPLMMASIIDNGVEKGDLHHIYVVGAFMVVAAAIGLFAGIMGGKYGAKASAGFAKNLRQAMFENIQEYSFSNIDKFSTAGLVTDHRCDESAECISDDPSYVHACTGEYDHCNDYVVLHQCTPCEHLSGGRYSSWNVSVSDHAVCNQIFRAGISKI